MRAELLTVLSSAVGHAVKFSLLLQRRCTCSVQPRAADIGKWGCLWRAQTSHKGMLKVLLIDAVLTCISGSFCSYFP